MGGVVLILALAFFKQGFLKRPRSAVSYGRLASAVLLVLAGSYIIYYWLFSGGGDTLPA